jgi:glutathione S-transferase
MSPYSEKVRLAMGLNNQAWVSVVVPAQPPRRSLEDLVGGYRRIPVLQIGAQFYCDSELALMALFGTTSAAWGLDADDEALRRWAEEDIFFAVIAAASPLKVLKYLFGQLGLVGIARFIRDRSRMMRDATVTVKASVVAAASVEKYVLHLAQVLAARPFLSGPRPGYLDLCCYHPLWMALAVDKGAAASWPLKVQEWITQMGQLTHGVSASASRGSVAEAITSDQVEISGEVSSPHH